MRVYVPSYVWIHGYVASRLGCLYMSGWRAVGGLYMSGWRAVGCLYMSGWRAVGRLYMSGWRAVGYLSINTKETTRGENYLETGHREGRTGSSCAEGNQGDDSQSYRDATVTTGNRSKGGNWLSRPVRHTGYVRPWVAQQDRKATLLSAIETQKARFKHANNDIIA